MCRGNVKVKSGENRNWTPVLKKEALAPGAHGRWIMIEPRSIFTCCLIFSQKILNHQGNWTLPLLWTIFLARKNINSHVALRWLSLDKCVVKQVKGDVFWVGRWKAHTNNEWIKKRTMIRQPWNDGQVILASAPGGVCTITTTPNVSKCVLFANSIFVGKVLDERNTRRHG